MHDTELILYLAHQIITRQYAPSGGTAFITREPVIREIFAAPFIDRVVHHLLYDCCYEWWDRRLDPDSYSCRVGKGTLYGIRRASAQMQSVTDNYQNEAMIKKLDLQGCFMGFVRERLLERVMWGLDRQFGENKDWLYYVLAFLWGQILLDDPTKKVRLKGPKSDWDDLPPSKSLFCQPDGQGMVIGNLTSQLVSNVYLDLLDKFVRFDLGYKYYGRYVDDFFMMVPMSQASKLEVDAKIVEEKLVGWGMTLHPRKRYTQPVNHGMEFLGVRVLPGRILPGKRIAKNFEVVAHEYMMGLVDDATIISYLGLLKHYKGKTLCEKVFASVGWEYTR